MLNNSQLQALAAKSPPPPLCLFHFASLPSFAPPLLLALLLSPCMGYVTHTTLKTNTTLTPRRRKLNIVTLLSVHRRTLEAVCQMAFC